MRNQRQQCNNRIHVSNPLQDTLNLTINWVVCDKDQQTIHHLILKAPICWLAGFSWLTFLLLNKILALNILIMIIKDMLKREIATEIVSLDAYWPLSPCLALLEVFCL